MSTHDPQTRENKSHAPANSLAEQQGSGKSTFPFVDNRPEAMAQRKLQKAADNSPQVRQLKVYMDMANNRPHLKQLTGNQDLASMATVQRNRLAVVQRVAALNTDLSTNNEMKGLRVSDGGGLGVVFIPNIVAKWEVDPDKAVALSTAYNASLSGAIDNGWSVGTPQARRATTGEAVKIANNLALRNQRKPGSVGNHTRVLNMIQQFSSNFNNVVKYEKATGTDFINYLAEGAASNAAAKRQSKNGAAKQGTGLGQLGDPGYARHLGRVALVDIFMGNRDRLHGTGNFENWMSDVRNRSITLVDNDISNHITANWANHADVQALVAKNFNGLATTITNELEVVLNHGGYGGGKLNANDQNVWTAMRTAFETQMADGLRAGYNHLWDNRKAVIKAFNAGPTRTLLRERMLYLHFGQFDQYIDDGSHDSGLLSR